MESPNVVHPALGVHVRGDRDDQNRRIGGIDLAVGGLHGKIGRQVAAGRVDRRLHVACGGVDVPAQIKLHRDARRAERAGGGHLRHAGDAAELPLQRRRHAGGHRLGAGTGKPAPTEIVGKSTCGSGETGKNRYARIPDSAMAIVSSVVPTGRLMNCVEGLTRLPPPRGIVVSARASRPGRAASPAGQTPGKSPAWCRASRPG